MTELPQQTRSPQTESQAVPTGLKQAAMQSHAIQTAVSMVGKEWLEVVTKPVSTERPAGENVRLGPLFERIEAEIAKLESLIDDTPIEWELMINWCREILKDQSKDILVACYLSRALCEGNLPQGLITATLIQLELAKRYWEHGFPPQKRDHHGIDPQTGLWARSLWC